MKRYIRSSHTSRSAALRALAQQLADDPEYTECEISVNADHNCVDIIFPDDTMIKYILKRQILMIHMATNMYMLALIKEIILNKNIKELVAIGNLIHT